MNQRKAEQRWWDVSPVRQKLSFLKLYCSQNPILKKNFLFYSIWTCFLHKHLKNVWPFSPLVLAFFKYVNDTQKAFIKYPKSRITVTCIVQTILSIRQKWVVNEFFYGPAKPGTSLFNFQHAQLNWRKQAKADLDWKFQSRAVMVCIDKSMTILSVSESLIWNL